MQRMTYYNCTEKLTPLPLCTEPNQLAVVGVEVGWGLVGWGNRVFQDLCSTGKKYLGSNCDSHGERLFSGDFSVA